MGHYDQDGPDRGSGPFVMQPVDRSGSTPHGWRRHLAPGVAIVRRLGAVGPALLVATVLPVAGVVLFGAPLAIAASSLRESGMSGALVFALGTGALAGLSIVPMHLLAILGGWTFALVPGLPAVMAGLIAAAAVGYAASAALARRRVVDLLDEHPRGAAVRRALIGRGAVRAAFVVALLRLSPVMPFAATNLVMAAVHVPFGAFMLGSVAGMLPRVVGGVVVGAGLTQVDPRAPADAWPAVAGIAATLLAVIVIGRIASRALAALDAADRPTGDGQPADAAQGSRLATSAASRRTARTRRAGSTGLGT
jgi:uncharacterized membrane protein YdjX (TVP38/TMEM64 family)